MNYKIYQVRKPSGGTRIVEEPSEELKQQQAKVLFLLQDLPILPWVSGLRGSNIVAHAAFHLDHELLISLDIKDFFRNTKTQDVLAGLQQICQDFYLDYSTYQEPVISTCFLDNHLPTGAPTSPLLSSIAFYKKDLDLYRLAQEYNLTYSRYMDDLNFSGSNYPRGLVTQVRQIIHPYFLNNKKISTSHKGHESQTITGVTINAGFTSVVKKYRLQVRAILDNLARNQKDIDEKTQGQLAYIYSVNKEQYWKLINDFKRRKEYYSRSPYAS